MEGDQDAMDVTGSDYTNAESQAKNDALEKKAVHLRVVLEKDYKAADFKWSLFVSAAHSYRYDACLRPFPPYFIKNGSKDMDELLTVIGEVPALDLLVQQLNNFDELIKLHKIIELLFWVLVKLKEPTLKTVPNEQHEDILSLAKISPTAPKPTHIFQVVSSRASAENKWLDLAKNEKTFHAFHGNKLENFHSIIFFGLHPHMNKHSPFGSGIYLASELGLSLPHSHDGYGWGASCLGGSLACLAMCEVINTSEGESSTAQSHQSLGAGEVSQTYYVVTNNDLVRVRYLLVYAKTPCSRQRIAAVVNEEDGSVRRWFGRHKLLNILLGYGVMLATIGLSNNQPMQFYYKMFLKKMNTAFANMKV